jgi:hypothetical protein
MHRAKKKNCPCSKKRIGRGNFIVFLFDLTSNELAMRPTRSLGLRASLSRYAPKYPRPRPGTAERPPYRASDPLVDNPKAVVTKLEGGALTFVHRPPPTAPTPYSLTTLPASPLLRPKSSLATTSESTRPPLPLPPSIRPEKSKESPPRMSEEDMAKLKMLRRSDPVVYTRGKLAKMFGCTTTFVGMVAPLKKSQCRATHQVLNERHEEARRRWSEKHTIVKAIRAKRRELW